MRSRAPSSSCRAQRTFLAIKHNRAPSRQAQAISAPFASFYCNFVAVAAAAAVLVVVVVLLFVRHLFCCFAVFSFAFHPHTHTHTASMIIILSLELRPKAFSAIKPVFRVRSLLFLSCQLAAAIIALPIFSTMFCNFSILIALYPFYSRQFLCSHISFFFLLFFFIFLCAHCFVRLCSVNTVRSFVFFVCSSGLFFAFVFLLIATNCFSSLIPVIYEIFCDKATW